MKLNIYCLLALLPAFGAVHSAFGAEAGGQTATSEGQIRAATGEILPPFGLSWGMDLRLMEVAVKTAGGRVTERQPWGPGEERWTVEGIEQTGLQRVLFSFSGGRLTGVELQYGKEDWSTKTYDDFMLTVRAELDAKHGEGRQLIRERTPDSGVLKTMLGYAWSKTDQSLALIYFSAQDKKNLFRIVSLHYAARPQQANPRVAQVASRS